MTMKVFNYNPDTGEFVSESEADESPLEPGVFLIPANATDLEPPSYGPGERAVFAEGKWSVETIHGPSSDAVKAIQWERIKTERDRLIQGGGYPLDGYWFHSDAYSLAQQQGLILTAMQVQASGGDMGAPLMATPWYAMGGVPVVMTASLALRLLPAAMAQQVAIFEAAKAHKALLDACADPADYDFSGGWPQVFGG
jgi:hypothetical protein